MGLLCALMPVQRMPAESGHTEGKAGRIPCAQIPWDLGLNTCQSAKSHLVRDCSVQAAEQQTPAGLPHVKGS